MTSPIPATRAASSVLLVLGLLSGCSRSAATDPSAAPAPATAVVTADDIEQAPAESLEEMLRGRVAGVWVSRTTDGGIAVRIRGTTSVLGNSEPLYVIDGVPIQPGPGGSLDGIRPQDVESIEVLKDAISTAMYGVRGANGVIVIKTKRPGT